MTKSVSTLLGLRREPASSLEMALLIQKGLPAYTLGRIGKRLALPEARLAGILGIRLASLRRYARTRNHKLPSSVSDRLYRMADLFLLAGEALEGEETARDWLLTPQAGLDHRVPCELLGNEASAREVEDLLLRIQHGVIS